MPIYGVLIAILLIVVALPDLGRPLNLAGAHLAAAEPSDTIMAAMIKTTHRSRYGGADPDLARREAWRHFGRGVDFARWRFVSASFDGAVMPLARLDTADLSDASLIRTDLSGASLIGARLTRTVLVEADLRDANLSCANASSCPLLAQAPRTPGTVPPTTQPPSRGTGTTEAPRQDVCGKPGDGPKLDKALFGGATLTGADLSNASLRWAELVGVKDLKDSILLNADLTEAKLKGLSFPNVDLRNACLCGADLRDTDLTKAKLAGATLRSAELSGAKLPRELQNIDFEGANIKDAKFIGVTSEGSDLQGANLSHVVQVDRPADFKPSCAPRRDGQQPGVTR